MLFGLWNKKVQVTIDRQKQVDINYATRQLEQGNLSFVLGNGANLVPRDRPILSLNDVALLEPQLIQQDSAEGSGVKRMMKGLYSLGQTQKDQGSSGERMVQVDRGTMTIAGDGIAFAGQIEQISVGFDNIEAMDHTHNEVMIITKNPARKLHFEGVEKTIVTLKVQDRVYSQPLSGKVLQLVIKAIMAKLYPQSGG